MWSDAYYGAGASDAISVAGDTPASLSRVLTPGARLRVTWGSPLCSAKPVDSLSVLAGSGTDIAASASECACRARAAASFSAPCPGSYNLRIGYSGAVYERMVVTANKPEVVVSLP